MVGLVVIGSFLAMILLRSAAEQIARVGDRRITSANSSDAETLVAEAEEWLNRRSPEP